VTERSQERLDRYARRADPWTGVAALGLVLLLTIQYSWVDRTLQPLEIALAVLLWVVLTVDVIIRLHLSPDRWVFVKQHPVQVASVLLPFVRVLLVGRVFAVLASRGGQRLADRATGYAVYLTLLAIVFGALMVVPVERDAPGATLLTFGDGLWWAIVTVATVGYGDVVPVTNEGRVIGVILILVSIGLLAVITANISSRFIAARAVDAGSHEIDERLDRVEAALAALLADRGLPVPSVDGRDGADRPDDGTR
jgi:voltage-gated potassium channel